MLIILPVFTAEDVAALPNAAKFLKSIGTSHLWVLHNPDIGLTDGGGLEQFDKDIDSLKESISAAAARYDFAAAMDYKTRLDSKILDRDEARRVGWKKVPQNYLFAAYDKALEPVLNPSVAPSHASNPLIETYEPNQLPDVLRGLVSSTIWPKHYKHGEFSVIWPRSVGQIPEAMLERMESPVKPPATVAKAVPPPLPEKPKTRREELWAKKWIGVSHIAKKMGIPTEKRTLGQMIDDIMGKESEQQVAA